MNGPHESPLRSVCVGNMSAVLINPPPRPCCLADGLEDVFLSFLLLLSSTTEKAARVQLRLDADTKLLNSLR